MEIRFCPLAQMVIYYPFYQTNICDSAKVHNYVFAYINLCNKSANLPIYNNCVAKRASNYSSTYQISM